MELEKNTIKIKNKTKQKRTSKQSLFLGRDINLVITLSSLFLQTEKRVQKKITGEIRLGPVLDFIGGNSTSSPAA